VKGRVRLILELGDHNISTITLKPVSSFLKEQGPVFESSRLASSHCEKFEEMDVVWYNCAATS
jgi:hypothetical protein